MDGCPQVLGTLVSSTNFTWADAHARKLGNAISVNYFRPDTGVALMPWMYTAIVIVVHLPMVFIRVTRWEIVQVWSIIFTAFTVVLYIQAYVSTKFDPAQILLWTPLILVIDAGSMAQVFFLVIEAKQNVVGNRIVLSETQGQESSTLHSRFRVWWWGRTGQKPQSISSAHSSGNDGAELEELQDNNAGDASGGAVSATPHNAIFHNPDSNLRNSNLSVRRIRWYRDPAILSASAAAGLFFAVLIIQMTGLVEAAKAATASTNPPSVSWCSPLFQPFGLAVVDSNCRVYEVAQSGTRGIGCIKIPGVWQQQWIKGTVAGTVLELICESIDVLILALVSKTRRVRGAKLKRPWATIFSGITVLGVTLIFGVQYSTNIPSEMGARVTVAMDALGPVSYVGDLTTAGLRGAIIGWNDGLLESWNRAYFGNPNF